MTRAAEDLIHVEGVTSQYIELKNGARAHYVVAGDEGNPPVILIHGGIAGSSGISGWPFMLPALAEAGFRVYAPDRPGFGLADTREEYWPKRGLMSAAQFIIDFADALGIDRFRIAGNSQGAQTSTYVAVNFPERIEQMALIATGGLNTSLDIDPSRLVEGPVKGIAWDGTEQGMRDLLGSIIHKEGGPDDEIVKMRSAQGVLQKDAYAAQWEFTRAARTDPNFAQLFNLQGRLDKLTIPTIYLYGRQDVLSPVENAYLQEEKLPNIQFFYPDNCGHQGQTDQPEMFNQVFIEFFRDGKVSKKTAEWAGVSDRRPVLTDLVEA